MEKWIESENNIKNQSSAPQVSGDITTDVSKRHKKATENIQIDRNK
jgi:hypothetical protein